MMQRVIELMGGPGPFLVWIIGCLAGGLTVAAVVFDVEIRIWRRDRR
jgi:hypothetical protein